MNYADIHQVEGDTLSAANLRWLQGLARALVRDESAADDLVQDTVVAALEAQGSRIQSPRGWLTTAARRLALRRRRDERRRTDHELRYGEAAPTAALGSAELVAAAEAAEKVAQVARALPEPMRSAVLQHYLRGIDPQEIARTTGTKADTVRWRLRRGLELMRAEFARIESAERGSRSERLTALLLPLTSLPTVRPPAQAVGLLAGTSAAGTLTPPLIIMALKLAGAAAAAILLTLGVLQLRNGDSASSDGQPLPIEIEDDITGVETQLGSAPSAELSRVPAAPEATVAAATIDPKVLSGFVEDVLGEGIEGALVYLVDEASSERISLMGAPKATTDRKGRFLMARGKAWLAEHPAGAIGAIAEGYLSVAPAPLSGKDEELRLVLRPGSTLDGRVLDPDGQPVPGLSLGAFRPFDRIDDLSRSRVFMNGIRRQLSSATAEAHFQARATTGRKGEVRLSGLGKGPVELRSLDPAWELVGETRVEAGSTGVQWTAAPRFSIRVVGSQNGTPILSDDSPWAALAAPHMRATFNLRLWLDDEEPLETGQWMGSGLGEVTLGLMPELIAGIDLSLGDLQSVQFFGTASLGEETLNWTGPIQSVEGMLAGTGAEVAVDFRGARQRKATKDEEPSASIAANLPMTKVELDVRFRTSGAPFTDRLVVEWSAELDDGTVVTGDEDLDPRANGRYELRVPKDEVSFLVRVWGASGSIDPWTTTKDCAQAAGRTLFVELEAGATARIERPSGWNGRWFVRASYRLSEDEPWFGSWNYSIDAPFHPLYALRPAEWRFELREFPEQQPAGEVRIQTLESGQDVEVR